MPSSTSSRFRLVAGLSLRIAFRNVRRNWRHSLAALGTMAVGFVALALFQGYLDELLRSQLDLIYTRNMIGEVEVRMPGSGRREGRAEPWKFLIGDKEQRFLDDWIAGHPADVKTRVRTLFVGGMAHAGGSTAEFWGWGHDVAEARVVRRGWDWNAWAGHPLREEQPSGVLLGLGIASVLGCERTTDDPVTDPDTMLPRPVERPFACKQASLTLTAASNGNRMNAVEAEVVGLTSGGAREFDERMIWMPLPFAQQLADTRGVTFYMIALHRPSEAPRLRAELAAAARAAGMPFEVVDWKDTEGAEMLRRGIDLLGAFRGLVVLIILVIAGAAVLTTMMKTVRERTREVGTMRSIGYLGRDLRAMFALEAAMLALLAGVIGLLSSIAVIATINSLRIMYKAGLMAESIPLRVGYSPSAWLWGFLFLGSVAVVAALLAARGVTRMRIAAALTAFD